ncbi:Angiotensin-converting enzyme, partial [Stylophora pistillata]
MKLRISLWVTVFVTLAPFPTFGAVDQAEEQAAKDYLNNYNSIVPQVDYKRSVASWNYATNLTDHNKRVKTNTSFAFSAFYKLMRENATKFDTSKLSADTARQIKFITSTATPKDAETLRKVTELESEMEEIYSTGKVNDNGKMLSLDPDLYRILSKERNYDRLLFAWKGWRDAVGPKLRDKYTEFVKLKNQGATENGWKDIGEYWRSWYEVEDLEGMVEGFWTKLRPLYQELHAYVRYKLSKKYPQMSPDGPIPAHLLGNMWAQSWVNIYDLVEPYGGKTSLDVTAVMEKQNYTAVKMFKLAEDFFTSIGLEPLPSSFYRNSMITKPEGREVICHASAWDFSINKDV